MILVCKKDFIQFETTTKKNDFTVGKAYKAHVIGDLIIKMNNDFDSECRFFLKPGVLLYVYEYFHDEQVSRDIVLKNVIK